MQKSVAVTGANSAVGLTLLSHAPFPVIACVRSDHAESALPKRSGSRVARVDYEQPTTLRTALEDCRAAIHLPGVLIERTGSSYEQANTQTTRVLLTAARDCGIEKIVLVSAIGADLKSTNRYYRSKAQAEQLVRNSGLSFTILRVPLVLGPGTEGSSALLKKACASFSLLLGGGLHLQQPLDVHDLAAACIRSAHLNVCDERTLELAGPERLSERDLVARVAAQLGNSPQVIPVPVALARAAAALRTRLSGPGFSPDAIEVITADNDIEAGAAAALGITLSDFNTTLREVVAGDSA